MPFVELNTHEIKHDNLKLLPERIARQYNAVVFDIDKKGVKLVAMEDPDDIQAIELPAETARQRHKGSHHHRQPA